MSPMKALTSFLKRGWIKSRIAEILASRGEMYPPPILCPRKTQEVVAGWAFAVWIVKLAFQKMSNIVVRLCLCSSHELLKIATSSIFINV